MAIHITKWVNALQKPSHTLSGTVVLRDVLDQVIERSSLMIVCCSGEQELIKEEISSVIIQSIIAPHMLKTSIP